MITKEELEKLIFQDNLSYESIGRKYGCTGGAIKKIALRIGIQLKQRRKINPCEKFSHVRLEKNLICPVCGKDFLRKPWKNITCSRECAAKYRSMQAQNKKKDKLEDRKWDGIERKDMWVVESRIQSNGYIWAKCPQHPNSFKDGYILEHRIVVENYLGRLLRKDEVVHHKDGNKTNNDISNLVVLTQQEHSRLHFLEREKEGRGLLLFPKNVAIGKNTKDGHFEYHDIVKIRELYSNGETCSDIAKKYGVTRSSIYQIVNRQTYKWVK